MKNWVLYFFAVLIITVTLPFVAKSNPKLKEQGVIILVEEQEMDLEDYTLRALLLQSNKNQSAETKKALAVAIRSQGYYLSVHGLNHQNFDVCTNSDCCLPLGDINSIDSDYLEQCKLAVAETEGYLLLNNNKPAMALFCICSGSGTVDCESFDYLKSVAEDERCDIHKTEIIIPVEQLGFSLSESDSCVVYDNWNKCAFAVVNGKYITSNQLQSLLGLKSSELVIEYNDDFVIARSYGAGKEFGMSLCGAEKLSNQGVGYKDILKKYYPELELIYNN